VRSRCCKGLQKSRRVLLSPATPDNTTISAGGTKTIQVVYQPPITDVSTGRSETEQTLTIQSDISATANITLTDVSVIARDAAAFDADMTDQELTLGESTEIHVTFESSQTGQRVAALSVLTNDPRQPGRVAFLSHTQTVIEIGFGSVTFGFEPDSDELPVLPPGTASVTTENTGRITQVQPAVSATNDFGFTFEENKPDPGPPGNNANPNRHAGDAKFKTDCDTNCDARTTDANNNCHADEHAIRNPRVWTGRRNYRCHYPRGYYPIPPSARETIEALSMVNLLT
jgi:hypothetical protein